MKLKKVTTVLLLCCSLSAISQNYKEPKKDSICKANALKKYTNNIQFYNNLGIFSHEDLCVNVQPVKSANAIAMVDTDGDGVPDAMDRDDDNDGILDIDEGMSSPQTNNIISNGGLEAPNTNVFTLPISWQWIPADSPICEATNQSSPNSASPNVTDINGPSPGTGIIGIPQEGNTFISGLYQYYPTSSNTPIFHEGIQQTVNLVAGVTYTMTFYQANVQQGNAIDGTGYWRIFLDNQQIFQADVTISNSSFNNTNLIWTFQSFTFTPTTSGVQTLQFLPFDDDANVNVPNGVRLGIDNIVLTSGITIASTDVDQDTILNELDLDSDNDGISDLQESGLDVSQFDPDNNGVIDGANFTDNDNDGLADAIEAIYGENTGITPVESTADADVLQNFIDVDSDGDTIPDAVEAQTTLNFSTNFSNDGNVTDDDTDGDGIIDIYDTFTGHGGSFNEPQNTENTDNYDYLDLDSDNDGIFDIAEVGNAALDTNNNGASNTMEGSNGMTNSLEANDTFEDPNFTINDPTTLPDVDSDIFSGGDVDYRDYFLTATVVSSAAICLGEDGFFTITGTVNATVTYNIDGGTTQTIQLDAAGNGTIPITLPTVAVVINITNISFLNFTTELINTATLTVNPVPMVQLGNDIALCEGDTTILDATTANATYIWQDGSTNATIMVSQAGTYSVEVTVNGCSSMDEINITYDSLPVVNLGADITLCQGETLVLDATTTNATYIWQNGSTNATFTVNEQGTYTVQVFSGACTVSDQINVFFEPLPTLYDFENLEECLNIQGEGTFNLFLSSSEIEENAANFETTFYTNLDDATDKINQIVSPENYQSTATTIYVRIENLQTNCFDIGQFQITPIVCEIFIPQGISPNDDGKNDLFNILNIENYPNHVIQIFNRYGSKIYEGNTLTSKWDGTYKGEQLPTGTYFYVINLNETELPETIAQEYQGWVYLQK
ncbi:gliding motility-associated C-terminal domain-containing protein [Kordia sp. SMS9]|uniref:gliding motility-associated C-terminal domain-containing protein n=1 Tax=Kordia sp. SMS9 TaxID=2282170 RepID=UPI0013B36E3C|nr:gliding motility-associated C-terminal domain-containing protein [Kordia sp. SMS9]